MADAMNGQIAKVVQCLLAAFDADTLIQMVATDDLGDLDVDELGGVEVGFFVQDVLKGLGFWRVKQPFEHGGGVEHDHCSHITGEHHARHAGRRRGIPAVQPSGGFAHVGAIPVG